MFRYSVSQNSSDSVGHRWCLATLTSLLSSSDAPLSPLLDFFTEEGSGQGTRH